MRKTLPNFWIFVFTSILFAIHFCMIECSFDVIDLSKFIIYDVQYVAATYGFKVNWIFVYANHKWVTHVLNALVVMFLRVHFLKMCNSINLLFNLIYMYFHQGSKNLSFLKMIYLHFFLKIQRLIFLFNLCMEVCCENG